MGDGANIGTHVKALHLFGISIDGTHWCGSRRTRFTLNCFLSWGGSQMLLSVEYSIPWRAILWLKNLPSADKICDLLQWRPADWGDLWSSPGGDTFRTVVMKPHVGGGKELEQCWPALIYPARAYYNYIYFHESSTKHTKKLHIQVQEHEMTWTDKLSVKLPFINSIISHILLRLQK